jgi:hypothetical protein
MDVLQRAADGTGGASELDRRIAWKALQVALQRSLPMAPQVEQLSITYARQPAWSAAVRTFPDILELTRAINAALGRSRPLQAADLLPPHEGALAQQAQPALDEAKARANAAADGLDAKVTALQNAVSAAAPNARALAVALFALAGFNLPVAIPQFVDAPNLLAQAKDVLTIAGKRQTEARSAIGAMAAASGWSAADDARTAVQAIFGRDLPFLVGFTPIESQPGGLAQAMGAQATLLGNAGIPAGEAVRRWMSGAARVRPSLDHWRRAALCSVALGSAARTWTVAQLPYRSGDKWVALPFGTATPNSGLVSLVLDRVVTPTTGAVCVGLVLDDWSEIIPAASATTALALHYATPPAQAPQTILLAVPPALGGSWNLDALLAIVNETLDLAHVRMTDASSAGSLGQLLPAAVLATNTQGDSVSTDFRNLRRAQ